MARPQLLCYLSSFHLLNAQMSSCVAKTQEPTMHCFIHIVILSIFPIAKPRRIFLISTDDISTTLLPRLSIEYPDENEISRVDYYNSILSLTSDQFGEAMLFDDLSAQLTMAPFRSQNGLRRTQILANQDLLGTPI